MRAHNYFVAQASLMIALVASPPISGQQQDPVPGVFGDVIDVRVVNLEVVVEDRDGNRVQGLTRSDFEILVDGEPQSVEYFNEVRGGVAIEGEDAGDSLPGVAPGKPVGTSYLVFVDDYFPLARDRNIVLDSLAEDLALLTPEDRVAVVGWNGRQPTMISSWSQSSGAIRDALEEAKSRPAMGLQRMAEQRRFDYDSLLERSLDFRLGATGQDFVSAAYLNDLTPEERFYISMLTGQVERSVRAAAATLRSFASPPGRKVLVLLMGGWPLLPGEFVVGDSSRLIYDWGRSYAPGDLFRDLTDTANRLGYTIYPVDVEGLARGSLPDASQRSSFVASTAQNTSFAREREVHATLAFLADETGGEAYYNAQRRQALSGVVADTRSYYWLGFTPTWQGDDSVHDVEVRATRPGLKVRAREDFLDLSRKGETTMAVESSLLFGVPLPGERLTLALGRPERSGRRKVEVPLEIGIPLDKVTLLATGNADERAANLELRIAVIDEQGGRAEVPVIPVTLEGRGEPATDAVFTYETRIEMRRGTHQVVVAVYDVSSGTMISGSAEISP